MPDQPDLVVEVVKPDGTKAQVSMRHLFGDVVIDKLLRAMGVPPEPEES
tara:strand:+ start:919 stop:1065 length:147 start_codon:yes stop_codon:yes gene_type:complete